MLIFLLYLNPMKKYVVLIANRYCPCDDRFWLKCDTEEQANAMASNYTKDHKFYADVYEIKEV